MMRRLREACVSQRPLFGCIAIAQYVTCVGLQPFQKSRMPTKEHPQRLRRLESPKLVRQGHGLTEAFVHDVPPALDLAPSFRHSVESPGGHSRAAIVRTDRGR